MDETTELGERLYELRSKAGYSQEQLADLLGISRQAISKWEGGLGKPEVDNIVKLARIYRVSADYILMGTAPVSSVSEADAPPVRRELPREYRIALSIVLVFAGLGAIFLVIVGLLALGFGISGWVTAL